VIPDPLELLEDIEATKRGLKPGEAMNPAVIESYLAALAHAVVFPDEEAPSCPHVDYRLSSVRAALLSRLARVYRIPPMTLVYDLTIVVSRLQDERLAEHRRMDDEDIERLERMWQLGDG
jgi:hypothetical protein